MARDFPHRMVQIELGPPRAEGFPDTARRQDRELERTGRDSFARSKLDQEGGDLGIGECSVMLDPTYLRSRRYQVIEVPFPPRRILAAVSVAARLSPIKHALDPPAQT